MTSPATAVVVFLGAWLVCGSILGLALRRARRLPAFRALSFAGGIAGASVAGYFGWARYRLWHSDDWTDPPQSFPYPDALLQAWSEALRVPPPPGFLDIHSGMYNVDFRLFLIIAVGWLVVGTLAGAAIPPQQVFASISALIRSFIGGRPNRSSYRPSRTK